MRFVAILAAVAGGAVHAAPAAAQTETALEEVVISASLRGESALDLPASLTVLGHETLDIAGEQHFGDVLGLVPNLNWSAGSSRPRYFQLRGIGELEQFQGAPNASVGFLIDGIDFSGIGMPATLFDVEQIEVLRGPQGTTYGANALAGLISVQTRDPHPELELRGEATAGEYGVQGIGAVVGGALAGRETAAFRLVGQRYRGDGFRTNAFLGRDDTNGYDETTVRGKLRWEATPALRLDFTAILADLDNGYDAFSIDNSRVTLSDKPGRDAQQSTAFAVHAVYSGNARFDVQSTTTVADSDIVYSFDGDWGNDDSWGIFAPYDFSSLTRRNRRTWSQDLRILSASGSQTGWVAGLYVLDARETNDQRDLFNGELYEPTTRASRYDATNIAAYGQLDFSLTERTRLAVGTRVERRDAEYIDDRDVAFDPVETMVGGHVSVEFALAERRNLYATLARGYKAGGFNISAGVPEDRREFDAEYLWNLETGLKARSDDGRFDAQVSLFYMRRTDQQVDSSEQVIEGDPLSFTFFTDNAARGENYGLEAGLRWQATPRWQLGSALGVLQTRYLGYRYENSAEVRDLDGREQSHAPGYQLALSAEYRHPLGWLARIDSQSVDDFYYSASHDERSRPFTLVNVKLGYETARWAAYAWARNLFDEEYAMRGFFFGNEPPDFANERYVQQGDPRHVGVTFTYSFQ